jgi:hypothetical protein
VALKDDKDIGGQRGRGMTRRTVTYIKGHWWCWKTMGCIGDGIFWAMRRIGDFRKEDKE